MTRQMYGQLPLFEDQHAWALTEFQGRLVYELTDQVSGHVTWDEMDHDEICDECGTACTSSRECVENAGVA